MGFFNFLERRVTMAEISTIVAEASSAIYFKELATYIARTYIANTLSKCEFKTYSNGKEVREKLYYMLNVSPNPNQNSSQFLNKLIDELYTDGHALVVPHGDAIYCADGFAVEPHPLKEDVFECVSIETAQIRRKYRASEAFYFKLDNTKLRSLIDGVYSTYSTMLSGAVAAYNRQNGKKYKLVLDNYKAGDTEFAAAFENVIKKQLETFMTSDNAIYPQFKGTNLEDMSAGTTGSSADVIAMRKEIFDTIAQAYKLPHSMMYGNITNMQEIVKVYLSICIDPLADMIGEELTRKTTSYESWRRGDYVKVDTSCISHADILEVADAVDKAISCGAVSVDEVRERLGMDALNTEFSTSHWVTKNYSLAENAVNNQGNE